MSASRGFTTALVRERARGRAAESRGDAVIHPGAVIFVRACRICTFYAPDTDQPPECPDCGSDDWWRVEALVQRVRR